MRKEILILACLFSLLTSSILPNLGLAKGKTEDEIELNPDYQPSRQDLEFARRSTSAGRWVFKTLPHELKGSLKESFWGYGSLAFALGAGLSGGLYPLDDNLQNSFERGALFGKNGNTVLGQIFAPYTLGGASLITWGIANKTGHPKLALTAKAVTEAIFLSVGIAETSKYAFRRDRPDGGSRSFPSGHAAGVFSAAGTLTVLYGWKAAIPSYAVAAVVSLNRIDDDQHFLSDVVMGAVIGTVIGVGTGKFHKKENPRFFLNPNLHSGYAGFDVQYIF